MLCTLHVAAPTPMQPTAKTPCEPNPCGQNAECKPVGLDERCSCLPGFFGNPYDYCRPECTSDPECPSYLACVNQKCIDPCPGTCGINAECLVVTHAPMCYCRPGYVGDPYQSCRPEPGKHASFYILSFFSGRILICMECVLYLRCTCIYSWS